MMRPLAMTKWYYLVQSIEWFLFFLIRTGSGFEFVPAMYRDSSLLAGNPRNCSTGIFRH